MRRIVPELTRTGPQRKVVDPGDDFVDEVKSTLFDYLRSLQGDSTTGNKYDDTSKFASDDRLELLDRSDTFDRISATTRAKLNDVLSTTLTTDVRPEDILSEIRGTRLDPNGVIVDETPAQPTKASDVIVNTTSEVLSTNRFSSSNPYMTGRLPTSYTTLPRGFGTSEPGTPVSFDDLKKVGLSLMLRATGELVEGDPTSQGVTLGSLLPGVAQLGGKIDTNRLRADAVPGAPGVDSNTHLRRSSLPELIGADGQTSYGQMNSCAEPFDGFMPIGMTGLAVALIVALQVTTRTMLGMLSTISTSRVGGKKIESSVNELTLGEYRRPISQRGSLIKLSDIGIMHIDRDFIEASREGIKVFFDFDGDDFKRVVRSPGFYANMARIILQSGVEISRSITEAFKQVRTGDILRGSQAVVGLIDVLKSSKIIAFMNIIAQLGDRSLTAKELGIDTAPQNSLTETIKTNPVTRVMKERDESDGDSLAWRQSSVPSALLMPRSMFTAGRNLVESRRVDTLAMTHGRLLGPELRSLRDSIFGTSRLKREDVEKIESILDSEYVPFYFHDLRTNEFLGFHAFISSVNESFAPNYNSTNPYGRVDPIMTYMNTTRTFNISFYVVATNDEDFDSMYVKLNKLVTLVYPQWTKGRQVVDSDGRTFRQPFSQLPSSSPLVRIRLGDLFRSNYSNLALARLFGVGEDGFLGQKGDTGDVVNPALEFERISGEIANNGWSVGQIAWVSGDSKLRDYALTTESSDDLDKGSIRTLRKLILGSGLHVRIVTQLGESKHADKATRLYKVKPVSSDDDMNKITFIMPENALKLTEVEVARQLSSTSPGGQVDGVESTNDTASTDEKLNFFNFASGDENAIVRSFKNVQGKGTAGFITSMNFDWNEPTSAGSWTVGLHGSRAPQFCKVDIAFTVIHDIAPGLDADGFNRAPVYTAGRVMNEYTGDVYDSVGRAATTMRKFAAAGKINGSK